MLKKVFEIPVGIMTVGFGGFDDTVNGSARFGPFGCIRKKPVLPAEDKRPDGIFDQVVVGAYKTALRISNQLWPFVQGIVDGLSKKTFRRQRIDWFFEPGPRQNTGLRLNAKRGSAVRCPSVFFGSGGRI